MGPMKLYFDVRDIFRAPRLALSGKKIWIMLQANVVGFVIYWIMTYLSLAAAGISFAEAWSKYGLYPCLVGNEAGWLAWILWIIGCLAWLAALALGYTAVARVTYKQLKGDEFYSSGDAWRYVKKHWHAAVFTHVSIAIIILFFVIMAGIFALIGKIPYFGELFFGIPYLLWFFGSVFVVYSLVVLVISILFTHAIVGTLEEDTMGAVFQNYSITWSQPWRVVLYIPLIGSLMYAGVWVFAYFMYAGYGLITLVFARPWLMGTKLTDMVGWATDIVIGPNYPTAWIAGRYSASLRLFDIPDVPTSMGSLEYIGAFFITIFLFLIVATVLSYGLTTEAVGETIALVIFKKKSDDENLLERKDEEELEAESQEETTEWTSPSEKESSDEESSENGDEDSQGEEGSEEA